MAWPKTGTLALTNGSTAVTGTGTTFVADARAGWAIQVLAGGDLGLYEIAAIASNGALTLDRPYGGTTGSGRAYQIIPGQGASLSLAAAVQSLISTIQGAVSAALAGIFGAGTAAAPGLRFSGDLNTGIRQIGADRLGLVTGGADRLEVNNAGAVLTGLLSGTAVTQTQTDGSSGRLLKVGDFGLAGGAPPVIGNAGVVDNTLPLGLSAWRYDTGAGSTGGPAGVNIGHLLHSRLAAGGSEAQLMIIQGSTGGTFAIGKLATRTRLNGAWTAWAT